MVKLTMRVTALYLAAALLLPLAVRAQQPLDPGANWQPDDGDDDRWNQMEIGPFIHSVLAAPGGTIAKGLSIRLGDPPQAAVAYDTKTLSFRAAWRGKFVKFHPRKFGIVTAPQIDGEVLFGGAANAWPGQAVKFQGMHQHGKRVVLAYHVGETRVLESPSLERSGDATLIVRTFDIAPHKQPLSLILFDKAGKLTLQTNNHATLAHVTAHKRSSLVALRCETIEALKLDATNRTLSVAIAPSDATVRFSIYYSAAESAGAVQFSKAVTSASSPENLRELMQAGKPLWPHEVVTRGTLGKGDGPYVIDTIGVPFENPYRALMFLSGHDFFADGKLAACTLHGDVWTIDGVDRDLDRTVWRRYATGLHQPLGLRIVDDKVYVLGRDQITRLHDRNGDGEADYYENFSSDGQTSTSGHDFAACLETDSVGNFYYIRAHEGVVRVSRDGRRHESLATGFRNPVGLGVGPDGTITAAPQEGTWTPASCIIEVKPNGYYGFGGPRVTAARPLGYDPPLCWMPRVQDNSSGSQVWVTSDRWGPLQGQMLHLSYGQCGIMLVPREHVGGIPQGGTIRLPLFFESGAMRGRFHPGDGQLYVSGLRGWQTAAAQDGCLQRVRYTGKPVDLPVGLHVKPQGIALTFTRPLDEAAAADPDNYDVQWWNYRYSKEYGSKDFLVSNPKRFGRDEVYIEDARLSDDRKTVYLELEDMQPVMQMQISYSIKAADGAPIKQTIYNTINAVPKSQAANAP